MTQSAAYFWCGAAARAERFNTVSHRFHGRDRTFIFSEMDGRAELHQLLERSIVGAPQIRFRFQTRCSLWKLWRPGLKIEAKFRTF